MEQEKNKNVVITLLVVIIVILLALVILFATGTISLKSNEVTDNSGNQTNENTNTNDNNQTDSTNSNKYTTKSMSNANFDIFWDGTEHELSIVDGKLVVAKKPIGTLNNAVFTQYQDMAKVISDVDDNYCFITGVDDEETDKYIRDVIEKNCKFKHLYSTRAGAVISSHCGPGTIGVLYLMKPTEDVPPKKPIRLITPKKKTTEKKPIEKKQTNKKQTNKK